MNKEAFKKATFDYQIFTHNKSLKMILDYLYDHTNIRRIVSRVFKCDKFNYDSVYINEEITNNSLYVRDIVYSKKRFDS